MKNVSYFSAVFALLLGANSCSSSNEDNETKKTEKIEDNILKNDTYLKPTGGGEMMYYLWLGSR